MFLKKKNFSGAIYGSLCNGDFVTQEINLAVTADCKRSDIAWAGIQTAPRSPNNIVKITRLAVKRMKGGRAFRLHFEKI